MASPDARVEVPPEPSSALDDADDAADLAGPTPAVPLLGRARMPTHHGRFDAIAIATSDGLEHLALVRGDVKDAAAVPVRVHSECLTGDVLGSLRCDCREQLRTSLEFLGREPVGILLYLRQEGRGIGLKRKVLAYSLQDHGLDTVDANRELGLPDDARTYDAAAEMLDALGVQSVVLLTNNPDKVAGLEALGVNVVGRAPLRVTPREENARYLETKRERMGHLLSEDAEEPPAREPS